MFEQLEDKSLLTVGVMVPSSHVPEGNGAIVYVAVSPPTYSTVTATYQTNAGTAIEDTDYDGVTGTVTIYPGQPYAAISIPVYHDFSFDPGETFSITLTGATGTTVNPANSSTTITIDDVPPPAGSGTLWITPTVSHNEGTNQGALTEYKFSVVFSGNIPGGFSVNYRARPQATGDVIPGKDFVDVPGTLSFAGTNGESHDIIINAKQDYLAEFDERFDVWLDSVFLANGNPAPVTHSAKGTGVIVNDDFADLRLPDTYQDEDDPPAAGAVLTFAVSLSDSAFEKEVVVSYKFTPVDATPVADYTAATGILTVTIPAEQFGPTAYPTSTVVPDITTEPNETFKMEIVGVAFADGSAFPGIRNYERVAYDVATNGTTITTDHFAVGTIIDDDQRLVTISAPIVAALEKDVVLGPTTVTFNVNYAGKTPSLKPFGVFVGMVNGSATFSQDFKFALLPNPFSGLPANTRLVEFAGTVGESHSVQVEIVGDTTVEISETFTAVASAIDNPTGNSGVSIDPTANSVLFTITNDDTAIVSFDWAFSNVWTVWEGDGVSDPVESISLKLSNDVDVPVYVEFTIAGSSATPATIPAIVATGFVPVVRGTDDISALMSAAWDNVSGAFWVVIPANTKAGTIDIKVLSDGVVESDEMLTVTLVGIGDFQPAAGRAASLAVSLTKFTADLKIRNDD
ncbi:MAG: Calx-beta domain-containing protein [Pirellulaceae bacterium]